MTNTAWKLAPTALTATTTTNIVNPPVIGTGVPTTAAPYDKTFIILRHVRVVNTTNGALRFALWMGGTGTNSAGKEFIAGGTATAGALDANVGVSVAANSFFDWYGYYRMSTADFLVGGASTTGLTLDAEGEIGIGA